MLNIRDLYVSLTNKEFEKLQVQILLHPLFKMTDVYGKYFKSLRFKDTTIEGVEFIKLGNSRVAVFSLGNDKIYIKFVDNATKLMGMLGDRSWRRSYGK